MRLERDIQATQGQAEAPRWRLAFSPGGMGSRESGRVRQHSTGQGNLVNCHPGMTEKGRQAGMTGTETDAVVQVTRMVAL